MNDGLEAEYEIRLRGRRHDLIEMANTLLAGLKIKTQQGVMTPPDHRMIHGLVDQLCTDLDVDAANDALERRLETGDVLIGEEIEAELRPLDGPETAATEAETLRELHRNASALEGAAETAVNDLRLIADRLENGAAPDAMLVDVRRVAAEIEQAVENPPGDDAEGGDAMSEYRDRWRSHVSDLERLEPNLTEQQTEVLEDSLEQLEALVDVAAEQREAGFDG